MAEEINRDPHERVSPEGVGSGAVSGFGFGDDARLDPGSGSDFGPGFGSGPGFGLAPDVGTDDLAAARFERIPSYPPDDPYTAGESYNPRAAIDYSPVSPSATAARDRLDPIAPIEPVAQTAPGGTAGAYAHSDAYGAHGASQTPPPPNPYATVPEPYRPARGRRSHAGQSANVGTTPLVLGILSIVFPALIGLVMGIVGIVAGTNALKVDSTSTTARAGRICSIVGTALSAMTILALIAAIPLVRDYSAQVTSNSTSRPERNDYALDPEDGWWGYDGLDDFGYDQELDAMLGSEWGALSASDEEAIRAAAAGLVERVAAMGDKDKARLAAKIDEILNPPAGADAGVITLSGIGLTSDEIANWLVTDVTYQLEGVYELSENHAFVTVEVSSRDFATFMNQFQTLVGDYMASEEFTSGANREEAMRKLGDAMRQAMSTTDPAPKSALIDVVHVGDTWQVDTVSESNIYYEVFGLNIT